MDSEAPHNCSGTTCSVTDAVCLPDTEFPRIVIVGGGFAGLSMVEGLKKQDIQLVLIDRNNFHQFQPLLYQVATSGLEPDTILFPFRKQISGYKKVIFRMAEVEKIQTSTSTLFTDKGTLSYDFLVLATGTATNFFGLKNIEKNSLGLKDIGDSLNIRHRMLQNLEKAAVACDGKERNALTGFIIVGGGPAGVEMAGALAEFCRYILPKDYPEYPSSIMKIYLVEASNRILSVMSHKASAAALKYLRGLNVEVLLDETVVEYDGTTATAKSKKKITAKNLIWTAGVKGQFPEGLNMQSAVVNGNRLKVNEYLKVEGYDNIFAMGDIAAHITDVTPKGHPQVAQPAIQQGKFLAGTLKNIIHRRPLKPFKYKNKGSLATVGKRRAVADLGRFSFTGFSAWLLWSLVHIMSISGFRNRLLVGINWAMSYFTYEKSNRLIIKNFKTKDGKS